MSDEQVEDAVQRVVDAWTVPGQVPAYHRAMQAHLDGEWPMLARALDRLARAVIHDGE